MRSAVGAAASQLAETARTRPQHLWVVPVPAAKAAAEGFVLAGSREVGADELRLMSSRPALLRTTKPRPRCTSYVGHLGIATDVANMCVTVCTPGMDY